MHDALKKENTFIRRNLRNFFTVLCVLCVLCGESNFVSHARAAEVRVLTLDQALEIAGKRNRDIQKAKEFSRQVEGKYIEERAAALPQLSLNANALWQQDDSQKVLGGGVFPTRQNTRTAEISLSQALFTWGKIGAAIRAAEKGFKTADERLRIASQDTCRDVSAAYYDILLARELYTISSQNREQKERHLDEANRRYAAGVATDYDVLAAQVAVENARPEVIRTENLIRSTRDRLRYLLALEDDVDVNGTLEAVAGPGPSYSEAIEVARKHRPEIAELGLRKEIAGELVKIANAEDKPRVDLKGGYGWRQIQVGSASGDGQVWDVGVFLTFPFFDGLKARGKVIQAESDLRTVEIEEAKLADSISLEIRDALNEERQAAEIVKALTGTVAQAERLLAMAEKGYELGVKIRLEVEDAELNRQQARGNLALARRNFLVARVNLERVLGVLGE